LGAHHSHPLGWRKRKRPEPVRGQLGQLAEYRVISRMTGSKLFPTENIYEFEELVLIAGGRTPFKCTALPRNTEYKALPEPNPDINYGYAESHIRREGSPIMDVMENDRLKDYSHPSPPTAGRSS